MGIPGYLDTGVPCYRCGVNPGMIPGLSEYPGIPTILRVPYYVCINPRMIPGLSEYPRIPGILRHMGAFAYIYIHVYIYMYIYIYIYMPRSRDHPGIGDTQDTEVPCYRGWDDPRIV